MLTRALEHAPGQASSVPRFQCQLDMIDACFKAEESLLPKVRRHGGVGTCGDWGYSLDDDGLLFKSPLVESSQELAVAAADWQCLSSDCMRGSRQVAPCFDARQPEE